MGERAILNLIARRLSGLSTPVPFGDDVSAVDLGNRKLAVLKSDAFVALTDMPPGMTARQAARKAIVINVSDMAAKGVQPKAAMIALGLPRSLERREILQLIEGLNEGATEYGFSIIGGDTCESSTLFIACFLFGIGERGKIPLRSGARVGDVIAVTGQFGDAPAGLRVLLRQEKVDAVTRARLLKAVYEPRAHLREGLALMQTGAVTASIDSSDGLAVSLHELSRLSKVGMEIDRVPISKSAARFASRKRVDPVELAFYGGEEFNLVLTINPKRFERARKAVQGRLWRIGRVTSKISDVRLLADGESRIIEARGWEHFKSET
jgi:thiamine-monophosphate kinase